MMDLMPRLSFRPSILVVNIAAILLAVTTYVLPLFLSSPVAVPTTVRIATVFALETV
jgi:hypothetical protein